MMCLWIACARAHSLVAKRSVHIGETLGPIPSAPTKFFDSCIDYLALIY